VATLDVGEVDPGVGADDAVWGLGHDLLAPPAQDAHRLAPNEPLSGDGILVVEADEATLGLGHHLLGDHDHVAVEQRGVGGDQVGQHVAGADLGQAGDGRHRDHGSSSLRARAAASARPFMTVGATTQRTPSASTAAARAASASSTTSVAARAA
jgi:hypothetical protein